MDPFATSEAIEAVWRALTDEEALIADELLARASRIIRQRIPDIDTRIDNGSLDVDLAGDIAAAMVLRIMRNPDAVRTRSESYADFSYSETVDAAVSAGLLYLADTEFELLSKRGSRAFSIAPSQEPVTQSQLERIARSRAWRDSPWPPTTTP